MNWLLILDHLPALPEVILLVGGCVALLADLVVADGRRRAAGWIAQTVLALCAAATLFVFWASGGGRYFLFNGLFVADAMGHVLKLFCYAATSATLVYSR